MRIQSESGIQSRIYYEVDLNLGPIGEGGMGQVYRAKRVSEITGEGVDVAIKFLNETLSPGAVERAKREASIRVQHENLIEMIDFIQIKDEIGGRVVTRNHVVSEFLNGVMLFDILHNNVVKTSENVKIDLAEELLNVYKKDRVTFSIRVIKNILSGIMALHDNGYIHRDLDPSNIMVTENRKIKIIDFGIAKKISNLDTNDIPLTLVGQIVGKPEYAAPELVIGDVKNQNITTDLYTIGLLFYEFLTGHVPFSGSIEEVMRLQVSKNVPLKEINDKKLRKIIAKATAKKQSERYQSAAEFRSAIEKYEQTRRDTNRGIMLNWDRIKQIGIWISIVGLGLTLGVLLKSF